MNNSRMPPFEHAYSDLEDCDVYSDERGVMLRDALAGNKFKYEYSAADSLLFQVTVVDK